MRLKRLVLSLHVALVSSLALAQTTAPVHPLDQLIDAHRNDGGEKGKTVHFSLDRGQCLFLGLDTGAQNKRPSEAGLIPLLYAMVRPATTEDRWDFDLTIWESTDKTGKKCWRIRPNLRSSGPAGDNVGHYDTTWQEIPLRQAGVTSTRIEKRDISKGSGIEGLQLWEIPYGEAEGEVHKLIVGIASDRALLEKGIAVSSAYTMFNWNKPWEFPGGDFGMPMGK
jgi:hypothetical protein